MLYFQIKFMKRYAYVLLFKQTQYSTVGQNMHADRCVFKIRARGLHIQKNESVRVSIPSKIVHI